MNFNTHLTHKSLDQTKLHVTPGRRWAFASGGADNIKKFKLPDGEFLHNFLQQPKVARGGAAHACLFWGCGRETLEQSKPPRRALSLV